MYEEQLPSTEVRRHRSWADAEKPRTSACMPPPGQDHNVVVRQVVDQRAKIEGHRRFPLSCRTGNAVDAAGVDRQTAASIFPNVLQEPEHCATRPAVLPRAGAVPEGLALEIPVDAGGAGHEIRQLSVQEIGKFQRHQDARPLLGKLVRDRAYEFRDFVGPVDLSKHDHSVRLQERDVPNAPVRHRVGRGSGQETGRCSRPLAYHVQRRSGKKQTKGSSHPARFERRASRSENRRCRGCCGAGPGTPSSGRRERPSV